MKLKDCKVTEYTFSSFTDDQYGSDGIDLYRFSPLSDVDSSVDDVNQESIRVERVLAHNNRFDIMPEVKKGRGIEVQENEDRDKYIREEIEKGLASIKETAFEQGYNDGWESGKKKVIEDTEEKVEANIKRLKSIVEEVLNYRVEVLVKEKEKVHRLINSLIKWLFLKELKGDGEYIGRVLDRLILESKSKSNILIKVDRNNFDKMPEILSHIENKMGEINNSRVEVDYDIEGPGIILDTENGIIDATLKEQFKALDKLFGSVGLDDIEEVDISEYLTEKELDKTCDEDKVEPEDGN